MATIRSLLRDNDALIDALLGYASVRLECQEHLATHVQLSESLRTNEESALHFLDAMITNFSAELEIFLDNQRAPREKIL